MPFYRSSVPQSQGKLMKVWAGAEQCRCNAAAVVRRGRNRQEMAPTPGAADDLKRGPFGQSCDRRLVDVIRTLNRTLGAMAITLVEHRVPNQLLFVVTGNITLQELMSSVAEYRGGERRTWAFLYDLSWAVLSFSADEVRQLADYVTREAGKSPVGPTAVIATDDAVYGMSRMYQAYSEMAGRPHVGVFRTREEAQQWLAGS
jgi:hypothetical protein